MACNFNCNQGRRCVCDVFHSPDFDPDAEDFSAESALDRFLKFVASFLVLVFSLGLGLHAAGVRLF